MYILKRFNFMGIQRELSVYKKNHVFSVLFFFFRFFIYFLVFLALFVKSRLGFGFGLKMGLKGATFSKKHSQELHIAHYTDWSRSQTSVHHFLKSRTFTFLFRIFVHHYVGKSTFFNLPNFLNQNNWSFSSYFTIFNFLYGKTF